MRKHLQKWKLLQKRENQNKKDEIGLVFFKPMIENDLSTYVGQMMAKFIVGEEPITKWDDYIANIKKMKIDEAIKIRQEAYDALKKTK